MKRWPIAWVIQRITPVRYLYVPNKMNNVKMTDNVRSQWGCGETGTLMHCWWECNLYNHFAKTIWPCLIKLKIYLLHDSAIPLLIIYPREKKTSFHKQTCTSMFLVALCIVANNLKQPKYPSSCELISSGRDIQWTTTQQYKRRDN